MLGLILSSLMAAAPVSAAKPVESLIEAPGPMGASSSGVPFTLMGIRGNYIPRQYNSRKTRQFYSLRRGHDRSSAASNKFCPDR